jgi:phenylalanyl-tRNA synthetase beta subunit
VYGYENIKAVLPLMPKEKSPVNKSFYYAEKVRHVLAELGFSEVYTYTLRDKGEVELENPLAKDKAFMRANLADGIRESLELNAHHAPLLGLDAVKIFEIGTVFNPPAGGGEHMSLAFGVKNKKAKEILEQALNMLKQVIPGIQGDTKDSVIEIHFDQAIQALPEPDAYESLPEETLKTYQPFSLYPFVLRDIALWVPEAVMESKIIELIKQQGGDLLVRVDLFDTFKKDGKISYAFHLVFQSKEKTLTDAEVGGIMDRITSTLKKEGGEVR